MTFSVLHASARAHKWGMSYQHWKTHAERLDFQYVLCFDAGVPLEPVPADVQLVRNVGAHCCVAAYNEAARHATGQVLILNSDDVFAPARWDLLLAAAIGDAQRDAVVQVSTGGQADQRGVFTVQILTRARYQRLGYVLCPAYQSMYADTEFSEHARLDGVVIDARHLRFEHRHPNCSPTPWDEVYARENAPERYACGREIFVRRRADRFRGKE